MKLDRLRTSENAGFTPHFNEMRVESRSSSMRSRDQISSQAPSEYFLTGPDASQRSVWMICHATSTLADHAMWLDEHVQNLKVLPDLDGVPEKAATCVTPPILLVDIDIFPTFVIAVDALYKIGQNFPEVPIAIASKFLEANDFSTERMHFVHASLRLPAGRAALALGLNAALANHTFFIANRSSD